MIDNRNITKEENKVLNDIITTYMFQLAEDEKEVIEDCREFKEAIDRLNESMHNYGFTFHEDIDDFITQYIAEKYNIDENEEILMYIDSENYFKDIYMETQDTTIYFNVEKTPIYIEVWDNFKNSDRDSRGINEALPGSLPDFSAKFC